MNSLKSRTWIFVAVGAMTFLLLQVHFLLAWKAYYVNFPWPGRSHAMEDGRVPPFFSTSPRSLLISCIVLFTLPLLALRSAAGRVWKAVFGLWLGVMLSVILIWISSKQLREDSNMWPIDLVLLSLLTALPLFLGMVVLLVFQKLMAYVRH